jgi:hypothetical protein
VCTSYTVCSTRLFSDFALSSRVEHQGQIFAVHRWRLTQNNVLFQLLANLVGDTKTGFGQNYPHKIAFLNRTGRNRSSSPNRID